MLMNCFEGNVGMDLGMEIPSAYKRSFLSDVAKLHVSTRQASWNNQSADPGMYQVQLANVLLPQIGTIESIDADGAYRQGPIPGLGGPFDTATEFFKAWASDTRFRLTAEDLQVACGIYTDEIHQSVSSFPAAIGLLADRISVHNNGPFPLCHGDFGHNNIIVDNQYKILGIIDWENAFAGPWEVFADFPLHLSTTPAVMDAPWNYNEDGSPKDAVLVKS